MSSSSPDITPIKAFAVLDSKGEVKDFSYIPAPLRPDQVEIKVAACGVCHSDVHCAHNDWGFSNYPLVCGHEIVGHVITVGSEVKDRKIGDRVGVTPQTNNCGECPHCKAGETNLCPDFGPKYQVYGSPMDDVNQKFSYGGFSERLRITAKWTFPIPDALPTAGTAPLLCAGITMWAPLAHYKIGKGHKVGIIGVGGLGHLGVQFASNLGADTYAISTSKDKAALAQKLGAIDTIDITDAKAVQAAANSFDILLCTVSNDSAPWTTYLSLLKNEAKFVLLGAPSNVSFNPFIFIAKRIVFTGHGAATHKQTSDMLEFCAKHSIWAMTEELEMTAENINKAFAQVAANKPRFRITLVNKA